VTVFNGNQGALQKGTCGFINKDESFLNVEEEDLIEEGSSVLNQKVLL